MICPSCKQEQRGHLFCTQCGASLPAGEGISEAVVHLPAEGDPPKAGPVFTGKESMSLKRLLVWPALTAVLFAALSMGLSGAAAYAARASLLVQDYTFIFYTQVLRLSQADAYHLTSERLPSLWDMLVLGHGGTWTGTLGFGGDVRFQLHLPVLSLTVAILLLFILLFKLVNKKLDQVGVSKIWYLLAGGVLYTLIITGYAVVFPPSLDGAGADGYRLSIHAPDLLWKGFAVYVIAGFIGLTFRRGDAGSPWASLTVLYDLRRFFVSALGYVLLVGVLMIAVWQVSDPSSFYESSYSMASVWQEYRTDPALYFLFPTALFQELLYALGGTWTVQGQGLSGWMGMQPTTIRIWDTGLDADIRWVWHPYALLAVLLYSLSRARIGERWTSVLTLTLGLSLSGFVLAVWTKVSFKAEGGAGQWIGFAPVQAAVYGAAAGLIYFGLAYLAGKWIRSRRGGSGDEA